ncbi:MAG: amino acid permease [Pseudomonadales bacterium]|nr:amino acid permease [Pseudomonadales bacterium]
MTDTQVSELKRVLSLPMVCLYGLGNILGAGIYVLIGRVAAEAGYFAPLAFILASLIAAVTAFSFAELSSRFPYAAGSALYVHRGFQRQQLTKVIGILIVLTGVVSAATMARGFVGYLNTFLEIPPWLVISLLLILLGGLASWGISQSVASAAVITAIEVIGLLIILGVAIPAVDSIEQIPEFGSNESSFSLFGLLSGSFLAFYAFIGFEDMVNVAEEVKEPNRNMPLAILFSLLSATVLYVVVSIAALLVVDPMTLGETEAPLALVYETATGNSPWLISFISLFAVINGALIQIIMGSRVLYGLARENLLPSTFARVNAHSNTPVYATFVVSAAVIIAALWLPIEVLARMTTGLLLVVFCFVNFALVRIKNNSTVEQDTFQVPLLVPVTGTIVSGLFLLFEVISLLDF